MSASEKVRKTPLGVMCIECPFRALSKPPAMPVVMTPSHGNFPRSCNYSSGLWMRHSVTSSPFFDFNNLYLQSTLKLKFHAFLKGKLRPQKTLTIKGWNNFAIIMPHWQ